MEGKEFQGLFVVLAIVSFLLVLFIFEFFIERSKYKKRLKNHKKGKTIEFN